MSKLLSAINASASERISRAFSKMTDKDITIEVLELEARSIPELKPLFEPDEQIAAIVYASVSGDVDGTAALVFQGDSAILMADFLERRRPAAGRELKEMDKASLLEAGNIVFGNFTSEICNHLGIELLPSVPALFEGTFGTIYQEVLASGSERLGDVLVFEAVFALEPIVIKGYLLLLFQREAMQGRLAEVGI